MVYQGLTSGETAKLETIHINLTEGKIYVPSTKRSNARALELKPWQIMEFMEYANEVRPTIQDRLQNHSEQLFPTNARFNSIVYHIFKKLKKYNQILKLRKSIPLMTLMDASIIQNCSSLAETQAIIMN